MCRNKAVNIKKTSTIKTKSAMHGNEGKGALGARPHPAQLATCRRKGMHMCVGEGVCLSPKLATELGLIVHKALALKV